MQRYVYEKVIAVGARLEIYQLVEAVFCFLERIAAFPVSVCGYLRLDFVWYFHQSLRLRHKRNPCAICKIQRRYGNRTAL